MDDLIQDFIAETFETLDALGGELVAWEADPSDSERLDKIFRFFHTVKGSCGFLNLPRFERLSHKAEDVLSKLRDGSVQPTVELVSAILAIIDRIAELTTVLDSGDPLPDGQDRDLLSRLDDACCRDSIALEDNESKDAAAEITDTELQDPAIHAPVRAIRIPLDLLDRLMNGVSDMVLARNEVARQMREVEKSAALDGAFERLSTCIADMRDMIGKTRMQRIERVFSPLPRLVRDLNAELGKQVVLETSGAAVELDREMIDMIRDPLMHIIRNSVDHGIETPAEREAAGKPVEGCLSVEARQSGNQILIEIRDDGRGIDTDRLVQKAIAAKIIRSADAGSMSESARLNLIFSPGLSTAGRVTAISGRGVGMDVVHSNITRIGGAIDLENEQGSGLVITLRVPLTLTIIACLTINAGDEMFALPRGSIREILHAENAHVKIETMGGGDIAIIRGMKIPLVTLETLLGLPVVGDAHSGERTIIAINAGSDHNYALSVPSVLDHEELVIRPGAPLIMENGLYAGTTLPDNGRPMLLLDPAGIAAHLKMSGRQNMKADNAAATATRKTADMSALLFRDRTGANRAIRLGILERVEDIETARIAYSAGQMRVTVDGGTRSVHGLKDIPDDDTVKMLLLSDGDMAIYYAISDVIDIHALPGDFTKASRPGLIAGVAIVEGQQIEIIDTHWLFAHYAGAVRATDQDTRPVCRIFSGDTGWARHVLVPLVESAGYEIAPEGADTADVYITMDDDSAEAENFRADRPVIRLASDPAGAGGDKPAIYRYDRDALMQALDSNRKTRKSA